MLNENLQKAVDELGDNPFKEPELFELLNSKEVRKRKSNVINYVLSKYNLDINAYDALELAEFHNSIKSKIVDLKDEKGNYKVTDNTVNCDLPNFMQSEELEYLWSELHSTAESEAKDKLYVEVEQLCWDISKLKKDDLSIWEQSLVVQQVINSCIDIAMTALGQDLKK